MTGLSTPIRVRLGSQEKVELPILEPVLTYELILPDGVRPQAMMQKLAMLEEEEPELLLSGMKNCRRSRYRLWGRCRLRFLKALISDRFGAEVEFGTGRFSTRDDRRYRGEEWDILNRRAITRSASFVESRRDRKRTYLCGGCQ